MKLSFLVFSKYSKVLYVTQQYNKNRLGNETAGAAENFLIALLHTYVVVVERMNSISNLNMLSYQYNIGQIVEGEHIHILFIFT
jgi:hypothetical protein